MKIKVCGLTKVQQVEALDSFGVDYAGFIFYAKSARYVLNSLSKSSIKNINNNIQKVGVFVNESLPDLLDIIEDTAINIVQLHGDETPEYCYNVSKYAKVIKAFQVVNADDLIEKSQKYGDSANMYLLDTPSKQYGGTGKKFDWNLLAEVKMNKHFLLSGGISPEDVDLIKEFKYIDFAKDLHAIDLNSRFETAPGIKDIALLDSFLKKIKEFDNVQ